MLILDKLRSYENFTKTEIQVAQALLGIGTKITDYSIRMLAEESYVSPATVVRLCVKLGYDGYEDFKEAFVNEQEYINRQFGKIDVNFPFEEDDSTTATALKLSELYKDTIEDTMSLFSYGMMNKIISLMARKRTIHIFSSGTALSVAESFKEKMQKIGKAVYITENQRYSLYDAVNLYNDDMAIIISYSGETKDMLDIARFCKKRHVSIVAITSFGDNTLSSLSDYVIHISTKENMFSNLGNFSTQISIFFILDLIYAEYFKLDYRKNYEKKKSITSLLESKRYSDNPIIQDETLFQDEAEE